MFDADVQSRALRAAGGGTLGGVLFAVTVAAVSWRQSGESSWGAESLVVMLAFGPLVGAVALGVPAGLLARPKPDELRDESAVSALKGTARGRYGEQGETTFN